ncbi:MAG: hypothetical protein K6L74_16100 [Neptuniibacter sp.]
MLEHLNDALCVSRFARQENHLWACYKPSPDCTDQKRKTWKPVTTLLSTTDMQQYLRQNYQEDSISEKFAYISTH